MGHQYNVGTDDVATTAEWAHGLMSATKSLLNLSDPVIERASIFWLTGPGGAAFTRDAPYGLYAQGEAMQVYAPALRGAGSVTALSFPRAPPVTVSTRARRTSRLATSATRR